MQALWTVPRQVGNDRSGFETRSNAGLVQDPPDPGYADGDVVVALQLHGDLLGAEVVLLTQPEDLFHDFGRGGGGHVVRGAGTVTTVLVVGERRRADRAEGIIIARVRWTKWLCVRWSQTSS